LWRRGRKRKEEKEEKEEEEEEEEEEVVVVDLEQSGPLLVLSFKHRLRPIHPTLSQIVIQIYIYI